MTEPFQMPILNRAAPGAEFTWHPSEADRSAAIRNHRQSLERLRERGGLSWCELAAILEHRDWHRMDQAGAKAACEAERMRRVTA